MENQFHTPAGAVELNMKASIGKAQLPMGKMILLGMLAGAFIALGGASSSVAAHGIQDVGLARTIAGVVFPVGLIMIVVAGGELFTGNCLMAMAALDKQIAWKQAVRNLIVVYFSNFAGALLMDVLLFFSGQFDYSGGLLGAYTIKIAVGKAGISPVKGVVSGILCNILVCAAILMAAAAKDIIGKIAASFFPIFAFVIGGYEHCVANMFYIPAGILAAMNPDYAAKAQEVYGITATQSGSLGIGGLIQNLVPVTIGNLLGGMLFVGAVCYLIHKRQWK